MLTIGLTGGIGSGKTYVSSLFSMHGIPCYYSDERAKSLMNSHPIIRKELISYFGTNSYLNELLNRPFIAKQVFKNKEKLDWLNNLVHPIVAEDFTNWKNKNEHHAYVLKEAAILIESGAYLKCDKIIVVYAPEELRVKRVAERDKLDTKDILERINNQISDKERLKYANFSILNNGIVNVKEEVEGIHQTIIKITT